MIEIRESTARSDNKKLSEVPRRPAERNGAWLARVLGREDPAGTVLLIGGAGLTDFRIRVAQSYVRRDLLPSFWSHVALIHRRKGPDWALHEVSLEPASGFGAVSLENAVQEGSFAVYDDPARYPNLACVRLSLGRKESAGETLSARLERAVASFRRQRSLVDLPAYLVEWLGFAWGASDRTNPLLREIGVPSAVFVESVFAIAGIELTPGIASRASCPEAIWQAMKWWHEFYQSEATITQQAPSGAYTIGQPAAAATHEPRPSGPQPKPGPTVDRAARRRGRRSRSGR